MLRGAGIWEVHFSTNVNFQEPEEATIKFGHHHDACSSNLDGAPAQSLTFFGRNNIILLTDGRVYPVWAKKAGTRRPQMIQVDMCLRVRCVAF
jgi:hypothetical protein